MHIPRLTPEGRDNMRHLHPLAPICSDQKITEYGVLRNSSLYGVLRTEDWDWEEVSRGTPLSFLVQERTTKPEVIASRIPD